MIENDLGNLADEIVRLKNENHELRNRLNLFTLAPDVNDYRTAIQILKEREKVLVEALTWIGYLNGENARGIDADKAREALNLVEEMK